MATLDKKEFQRDIKDFLKNFYRKTIKEADKYQLFNAVAYALKEHIVEDWMATHKAYDDQDAKMVYYLSMEFLMGRALGNNIINMQASQVVKEALEELGLDLNMIEDAERDYALGNGGLGRLAAWPPASWIPWQL